jgi:hypothetical protein
VAVSSPPQNGPHGVKLRFDQAVEVQSAAWSAAADDALRRE